MLEAGIMGKKGPILADGFNICPATFAPNGFSVVCDMNSSYAVFFVNGKWERREGVKPFTISGDILGSAKKWMNVPVGIVELRCDGESGSISAKGNFDCESEPEPEMETDDEEEPVTQSTATASANSTTQGHPVQPMEPVGVDEKYCVTIPALSYEAPISQEWEALPDGSLGYLMDNNRTWTVGSHRAPVKYNFTVPITSTYGITMDSETPHSTEHNDIWITFDSITLRGKDEKTGESVVDSGIKKALKAYQNSGRRSKIASSVDFNPHTFSTTEVLVPGKEYTIIVGARSTKFKLFGLILFPCTGEDCVAGKQHWQQYLEKCNV